MHRVIFLFFFFLVGFAEADSREPVYKPEAQVLNFKVFLDDREVGWHTFTLTETDGDLLVTSNAKMDFRVLLFKKIRYRHEAREVWRDGCLQSIESATERNGEKTAISGSLSRGQFVVNQRDGETQLGDCVKSFAYWRPEWFQDNFLLNIETGDYTEVELSYSPSVDDSKGYRHISMA